MKKQHIFEFSAASEKTTPRTTVGFRLGDEKYVELSRRAKGLGVSPHELARYYVVEMLLEKEGRTELRKVADALGEHIREAGKDIALASEALLSSVGTVSEKQTQEWTRQNLNPE